MKFKATKPVSIFWQTVFIFVLDWFAMYRIKKFRSYLYFIVLPYVVISNIISIVIFPTAFDCIPDWILFFTIYDTCQLFEVNILTHGIYGGFLVFAIYLIRKWSVEWNNNFQV